MSTREQLDLELRNLADMLPIWLEKLRHIDQFWPQFDALAREILVNATPADIDHVNARLAAMLSEHEMVRPEKFGGKAAT